MRSARVVLSAVLAMLVFAGGSPALAEEPSEAPVPLIGEPPENLESDGPVITAPAADGRDLPDSPAEAMPEAPDVPPIGATGYVEGQSVEQVTDRDEFSKTYLNPDGTVTTQTALYPLHFRSDGEWTDIDPTLSQEPGGFVSGPNSWRAHFGALPEGVRVETADGDVTFSPVGATSVAPELLSPTEVIYRDAWPTADLVYRVTAEGVKEDIVLRGPPTVDRFEFTTNQPFSFVDGALAPALEGEGSVPAAEVLTANGTPIANSGATISAISWAKTTPKLVVRFDRTALAARPASDYPIAVDPPFVMAGSNMVNYKSDGFIGCSPCGPHVRFGNSNEPQGPNYWRTVGDFNYTGADNYHVVQALFALADKEFGTDTTQPVSVYYAPTKSWAGAAPAGAQPIGSGSVSTSGALIDVTGAYRQWIDSNSFGRMIGFKGAETSGLYSYKAMRTFQLWMTLNEGLVKPEPVSPATGFATNSVTPSLVARNKDARAAYMGVSVVNSAGAIIAGAWCGGATPTLVAANATCSMVPTLPAADANYAYAYFSYLPDTGDDDYSDYSDARTITVDRTAPVITAPASWPVAVGDYSPYPWSLAAWVAGDLSGISGFSYKWDQIPTTVPPMAFSPTGICAQTSTADPNDWFAEVPSFTPACDGTGTVVPAEGTHYLHLRARNGAGLWSDPIHITQRFDRTPPNTPAGLFTTCAAPATGGPRVTVQWGNTQDALSGVRGYSWTFNNSATPLTSAVVTTKTETKATSDPLSNGTWYFHLRAADKSVNLAQMSNTTSDVVYGPFTVAGGKVTSAPAPGFADFAARWLPRLGDVTYLTSFLDQLTLPIDVLNEGYHALTESTRRDLAACLATSVAGPDDDVSSVGNLLYEVIFNQKDLSELTTSVVGFKPTVGNYPALPDSLMSTSLIDAITKFAITPVQRLIDGTAPTVPSRVNDLIKMLTSERPVDIPQVVTSARDALTDTLAVAGHTVEQIDSTLHTGVGDAVTDVIDVVRTALDSLSYRVCATYAQQPANADPVCTNPILLGSSTTVDVTGDGQPDVSARLAPSLQGLLAFDAKVARLSTTGPAPRAHVWFQLDLSDRRVTVGFDGQHRGDHLVDSTTLGFQLAIEPSTGSLKVDFSVDHSGNQPAVWALSASLTNRQSGAFTTGDIRFTPTTDATGYLNLRGNGDLGASLDPATAAVVDVEAIAEQVQGGTRSRVQADANIDAIDLPLTVDVTRPADAVTKVSVNPGGGAIARVEGGVTITPNMAVPADLDVAALRFAGLSGTSAVEVSRTQPFRVDYTGSPLHDVAVSASRVRNGVDVLALASTASQLPGEAHLTVDSADRTTVTYSASGTVGDLRAAVVARTGAGDLLAADLHATSLPKTFTVTGGSGGFTASNINPATGLIDLIASVNETEPARLPGEHVSVRADVPNAQGRPRFGLSTRITGLKALDLATGATTTLTSTMQPGGQAFRGYADVNDGTTGNRHVADVTLGALPAAAKVVVDMPNRIVSYDGDATARVEAMYTHTGTGPTVAAKLSGLPSHVAATWLLAPGDATVKYDTVLPNGSPAPGSSDLDVSLTYSPDSTQLEHPDTDRYVTVEVQEMPSWAGITVGEGRQSMRWQAAGSTGLVRLTTRNLLSSQFAARAELSGVPSNWDAAWGSNHYRFRSLTSERIGSAEFAFATDGNIDRPVTSGWWLGADYNEVTCGLEVGGKIANVKMVEYYGGPTKAGTGRQNPSGTDAPCAGGQAAPGTTPVFQAGTGRDGPVSAQDPPGCRLSLADSGLTGELDTDICLGLDINLAGAPLYVDGRVQGKADKFGTDNAEFTRQLLGFVDTVPSAVHLGRIGYRTALAASSSPPARLEGRHGWTKAMTQFPAQEAVWERGIFAADGRCPDNQCRLNHPDQDPDDGEHDPDPSPFCTATACYAIRLRASFAQLPSEALLDMTPFAVRVRLEGVNEPGAKIAAGLHFDHARQLDLRLVQNGVPVGATLVYGPVRYLDCADPSDLVIANLLSGLLTTPGSPPTPTPPPTPQQKLCGELEAQSQLSEKAKRIRIETDHTAAVGNVDVSATMGNPSSVEGSWGGELTIGRAGIANALPAKLDTDIIFGQTTRVASASGLSVLRADLECVAEGKQGLSGAFELSNVPAHMQLDAVTLEEPPNYDPPSPGPKRDTVYRHPACGSLFKPIKKDKYPGGDPQRRDHLYLPCTVATKSTLDVPSGEPVEPVAVTTIDYNGDGDNLSGYINFAGDFGVDMIDHRANDKRAPNVRVDVTRASFEFTNLRRDSQIMLNDNRSVSMRTVSLGTVADLLTVSSQLRATVQTCTMDVELAMAGGTKLHVDGTLGLDAEFEAEPTRCLPPNPAAGCAKPSGVELRVTAPKSGFALRASSMMAGYAIAGRFDKAEFRLRRPKFDYTVDLDLMVAAPFVGRVYKTDIDLVQNDMTSIRMPVFFRNGVASKILDTCAKYTGGLGNPVPVASVKVYSDPSTHDYDQPNRPNEIVINGNSDAERQYGFTFLPTDVPTFAGDNQFKLNLLGGTIAKAGDGVFDPQVKRGPQHCL